MNDVVLKNGKVFKAHVVDQFAFFVEACERDNGRKPDFFHYSNECGGHQFALSPKEIDELLMKIGREDLI